jgi:hypothetical protein
MNLTKKVGWQKYEDLLQDQLESPLLDMISQHAEGIEDLEENEIPYEDEQDRERSQIMIPVNERLMENISIASNFNCWMAHTNFNITEEIREKLSETSGVEVLKVCSRYRFFIGIGKMFDFSEVRAEIEQSIADKGQNSEQKNRKVSE